MLKRNLLEQGERLGDSFGIGVIILQMECGTDDRSSCHKSPFTHEANISRDDIRDPGPSSNHQHNWRQIRSELHSIGRHLQ